MHYVPTRKPSRIWIPLSLAASLLLACGGGAGVRDDADGGTGGDAAVTPDADLCGVGDDEKVIGAKPRIYFGKESPDICMSTMQQRAVGALTFQEDNWSNACTGTLISDDVVLTAAHCVQDWRGNPIPPSSVRFHMGPNAVLPEHTFNVAEVHAHASYEGEADHDVGVLVLTEGALSTGVNVIPIPANTTPLGAYLVGEWAQNAGYGATHNDQNNHLRWWTTEEVTQVLPGEFIVYGQGESSVCWGDSGGPSMHLYDGERLVVLGTVSWGDQSCVDYDHFARADDNQAFIETYTGAVDPCFGIDAKGLCDGDVAIWCKDGALAQQCCGAEGMACIEDSTGDFRCEDQCGDLTWEGRCNGDVAQWCEGGEIKSRRCGPCDQVCGWAGDVLGNYCVDE